MSHLHFKAYEKSGKVKQRDFNYSQSVKVGDQVYISGQGGWLTEDPECYKTTQVEQIDQTFLNIQAALREAGADFAHVFKVVSYHKPIDDKVLERVVENFKKHMPSHNPLWTCIEVTQLGDSRMEVEIEVIAHVPK